MPTSGLAVGTLISTPDGWKGVEALDVGDLVDTLDHGPQNVLSLRCSSLSGNRIPRSLWPLRVPEGALGNEGEVTLLAEQKVMVPNLGGAADVTAAMVLVPASALIGFRGIERIAPPEEIEVIAPMFRDEEIVIARASTYLLCPCLPGSVASNRQADDNRPMIYDILRKTEARQVVLQLIANEGRFSLPEAGQADPFAA